MFVAVFIFVNFCGGLSRGCWAIPVFVELPMLILSGYLCKLLAATDPELMARLQSTPCLRARSVTSPTMTTHAVNPFPTPGGEAGATGTQQPLANVVHGVPIVQPPPAVHGDKV